MTKGEVLRYAIAFALRRSRKIIRGLKEGLTEEERSAIATAPASQPRCRVRRGLRGRCAAVKGASAVAEGQGQGAHAERKGLIRLRCALPLISTPLTVTSKTVL
jgi:hypothetical protein